MDTRQIFHTQIDHRIYICRAGEKIVLLYLKFRRISLFAVLIQFCTCFVKVCFSSRATTVSLTVLTFSMSIVILSYSVILYVLSIPLLLFLPLALYVNCYIFVDVCTEHCPVEHCPVEHCPVEHCPVEHHKVHLLRLI